MGTTQERTDRAAWRRLLAVGALALALGGPGHAARAEDWVPVAPRMEPGGAEDAAPLPEERRGAAGPRWKAAAERIRGLVEAGRAQEAYRLAEQQRGGNAQERWEAALMAGWIALRFLDRPEAALPHFEAVIRASRTPSGKSAGAYWLGRTHQRQGRQADAAAWFRTAAQHGTTFYGNAAAARLGSRPLLAMSPQAVPTRPEIETFAVSRAAKEALRLHQAGDVRDRDRLLIAMASRGGSKGLALVGRLARQLGIPHIAVRVAKMAEDEGVVLSDIGYPLLRIETPDLRVPQALVHAIIREESNFDQRVVSGVGAVGLMQLMDGAVRESARDLGVRADPDRAARDPQYNLACGSRYIGSLYVKYKGNPVLAIAAYNAGPGRVDGWLERYGDPRSGAVDTIDWIESIPFTETRVYVRRVMASYAVYERVFERIRAAAVPVPSVAQAR